MADVVITRYRTGFRLQTTDAYLRNALTALHETLTRPKIERSRGRVYAVPGDKFYIESVKESAYYYIDALYDHVIQFIRNTQLRRNYPEYTIDVTEVLPHEGNSVVFDRHSLNIKEPEDSDFVYQNGIVDYASESGRKHTILELQTGKGKALENSTPVKTPTGWTPIGELSVGDSVIAKDGTVTKVLGVYPQGNKQLYRVNFADDRWVECCAEHLWKVYYINTSVKRRWRVVNTLEMMRLISMPNPRVYIDLPDPEPGVTADLPIPPYMLGVLLGDGYLSKYVTITTPDPEIINEINKELPDSLLIRKQDEITYGILKKNKGRATNDCVLALRDLKLAGCISYYKFIPKVYLHADKKQRLALLQGMMDTDGTIGKNGTSSYSTSSKQLAEDFVYLVRSLGGIARTASRIPTYTYKGEKLLGKINYNIIVRMKRPSELFRLPKKKNRTNDDGQYCDTLKLRVKSIESSVIAPATCISVDHPDELFVCKDYIVTHNTKLSMKVANQKGKRILVITKAAYVSKWLGDLSEDLNLRKGELIKIDGADGLQDMIDIGKAGRLDPVSKSDQQIKAMVISSHALDKYIDNFLKFDGVETHPSDILRHLDVGFVIYDETHQLFRMNYWSYLIMNAPDVIDLSATLVPDDAFLKARYMERLPGPNRYDKLEFDKYIDAMGIMYGIEDDRLIRSVNSMSLYNHMAFEGKLLKSKKMQKNYFAMCDSVLGKLYFKDYQPGQKALVFFSTQQMCTEFADYMQKLHPTHVVKRYIQGDKYEDMQKGDIIVSTPGKSGTAVDIKGLVISLSTVMIDDTQANLQMLGRTRKTKQWDIDVRMVYMFCRSVRKHMRYHEKRTKMYKGKVKSHMILNSSFMI